MRRHLILRDDTLLAIALEAPSSLLDITTGVALAREGVLGQS